MNVPLWDFTELQGGDPGKPPFSWSLANAQTHNTGHRIRTLPLSNGCGPNRWCSRISNIELPLAVTPPGRSNFKNLPHCHRARPATAVPRTINRLNERLDCPHRLPTPGLGESSRWRGRMRFSKYSYITNPLKEADSDIYRDVSCNAISRAASIDASGKSSSSVKWGARVSLRIRQSCIVKLLPSLFCKRRERVSAFTSQISASSLSVYPWMTATFMIVL